MQIAARVKILFYLIRYCTVKPQHDPLQYGVSFSLSHRPAYPSSQLLEQTFPHHALVLQCLFSPNSCSRHMLTPSSSLTNDLDLDSLPPQLQSTNMKGGGGGGYMSITFKIFYFLRPVTSISHIPKKDELFTDFKMTYNMRGTYIIG